jgi:hypothetical protein
MVSSWRRSGFSKTQRSRASKAGRACGLGETEPLPLAQVPGLPFRVAIDNNAQLAAIGDWPWLEQAGEVIIGGGAVTRLSGLNALTTADSISIENFAGLTRFEGLQNLKRAEILRLYGLPKLTSLSPLRRMDSVGMLSLETSDLTDLSAFSALKSANAIHIEDLPQLKGFAGLSNLKSLESLVLLGLPLVKDLNGVSALESLHWVSIKACNKFASLQGAGRVGTTLRASIGADYSQRNAANALSLLTW